MGAPVIVVGLPLPLLATPLQPKGRITGQERSPDNIFHLTFTITTLKARRVNLRSLFILTRHKQPLMQTLRGGTITENNLSID